MNKADPATAAAAIEVGVVFGAIGLAVATDFRGLTDRRVRESIRRSEALTRIPPWSWLPARLKDPEATFRFGYRLDRFIGCLFAAAGIVEVLSGLFSLLRGLL